MRLLGIHALKPRAKRERKECACAVRVLSFSFVSPLFSPPAPRVASLHIDGEELLSADPGRILGQSLSKSSAARPLSCFSLALDLRGGTYLVCARFFSLFAVVSCSTPSSHRGSNPRQRKVIGTRQRLWKGASYTASEEHAAHAAHRKPVREPRGGWPRLDCGRRIERPLFVLLRRDCDRVAPATWRK